MTNLAKIISVPAPIGGLNAYDNLASMASTDALQMINFVPTPYGCTVRKGSRIHDTIAGGNPILSLAGNMSIDGTRKVIASVTTGLWDVTAAGSFTEILHEAMPDPWQSLNFANAAGTHTVMFNGANDGIWYNKTLGLQRLTAGDGVANGTWKNVDPKTLVQGTVHQRRIWAVQKNSTFGWFLPGDAVFGEANYFDFGPFFKQGGVLRMLATWSADLGSGSDDNLIAISSEGEAVVFAGTDVTDSTKWALKGTFRVGAPPAGYRFVTNVGGDLLILTRVGVVSMSTVLTSTSLNSVENTLYSKKIQYMLNELITQAFDMFGWELRFFPSLNMLYVNIPNVDGFSFGQLVSNHVNSSWCTFADLYSTTWFDIDGIQYFGTSDGRICIGATGTTDFAATDGTGGTGITAICQQAYTDFQIPAVQKQVGMYRPTFQSGRTIGSTATLKYDFVQALNPNVSATLGPQDGALWASGKWGVSYWGGATRTQRDWRSAAGIGTTVSLVLGVNTSQELTWVATDYLYKLGGAL